MMRLITVFVFTLVFQTSTAFGCTRPPKHLLMSHEAAIKDAEWIVHAKAHNRVEGGISMRALAYLKGNGPEIFTLQDATTNVKAGDELEPSEGNYYGHTTSKFWVDGGRSFSEPDCRIDPVILFGEREYVIFGPLDYNVGFENIAVEGGDKWLEFIKKRLRGDTSMRPFPKPLESYLANSAAIVRFRAEWLKDKVIWSEEVLKGDMSSYAHALFISPAAFFDTAVNPNCSNYGYRKNAELFDRIYVIERLATQKSGHYQRVSCVGYGKSEDAWIEAWATIS
ncbi:MAG: hypothetical protein AAF869_09210, partial [Pseudomonadota bacterium]